MKATIEEPVETLADGSARLWADELFADAELVAESMGKPVDLERASAWTPCNYCYDSSLSTADVEQGTVIPARLKYDKRDISHRHERSPSWPERYRAAPLEVRGLFADRREPIPDGVRMFVWQRDRGCCVQCGSKENLEFDHFIPVVKGGSNTERNLQLLCECCNRTKYDSVSGR